MHEIDETGGIARVAFAREPAWHGLGKVVPDSMTVEEAIEAAGLDWEVELQPIYAGREGEEPRPIPGKRAIVREDSQAVTGIVSTGWQPVQNRGLGKFIESVCGEGARLEAAGSLRGGKRIWFLLDLKRTYEPIKGDPVNSYLVFANGHDGVTRLRGLATDTRVVCANTWAIALEGANEAKGISFRHDGTIGNYVAKAQEYIGKLFQTADKRQEQSKALAKMVKMKDEELAAFFIRQLKRVQIREEKELKSALEVIATFQNAKTNTIGGMEGTGWAAFQTWSEFLDYRPSKRNAQASRWESNLFGEYSRSKTNAWNDLLALAK
jgi:phage/plasmid-like protein (TIGR03299 family)